MRIIISGKKTTVTPALRDYARKKGGRLDRYFDGIMSCRVMLTVEGRRQVAEVELHVVKGGMILSAAESDDLYGSLDRVFEKLPRQIKKYKAKLRPTSRASSRETRTGSDG